jgi:hypothetical protein
MEPVTPVVERDRTLDTYKAINATSIGSLNDKINTLIDQGFVPQGGVSCHKDERLNWFSQAMFRKGTPPQPTEFITDSDLSLS